MTPKTLEQMAEEYATSEKLPTKGEWIETRGGEHAQYLSYEVRWSVVDGYLAGAKAALSLPEVRAMREALERIASWETNHAIRHIAQDTIQACDKLAGDE